MVREAQDKRLIGKAKSLSGFVWTTQGNTNTARPLIEEGAPCTRISGMSGAKRPRSTTWRRRPSLRRPRCGAHYEKSLRLFLQQGDALCWC